jgi:hypothetical protein
MKAITLERIECENRLKSSYENEEYCVVWAYSNGFYEIREGGNNFKIELVHSSNFIEIDKYFDPFSTHTYYGLHLYQAI